MSDLHALFTQLNHQGRKRILVLGDIMLDRYTWGDAERVSPEAPVIVLRADQEEVRPGGAASVAYLLRHLEVEVSLAGVIGNDSDGHTLRAILRDEEIDDQLVLVDPTRPTTAKHRFVGRASDRHPHQILRVDHESRAPLSESLTTDLWTTLKDQLHQFDAILIPDYLKGVCTEPLLQSVITAARANGEQKVLIDPGRTTDYHKYRGATLLKPNRLEAELVAGKSLTTTGQVLHAGRNLCESLELDAVMITLDRDGLIAVTPTDYAEISTEPRAVYDITGAGDMVLAALGLCLASDIPLFDAARIANIAAGLEVERFGIAPVTHAEIEAKLTPAARLRPPKLVTVEQIVQVSNEIRRQGKKIIFTNGCFDLLHVGHVTYLQEAAASGDVLIVAVNSDASVRRLKGPTRPIIPEQQRATMLAALDCVDLVVIFDDDTPISLLQTIRPDVLIKGGTTSEIVGREIVEGYGGRVCLANGIEGLSTTQILERATQKADVQTYSLSKTGVPFMRLTNCECPQPGWCDRHQCDKSRPLFLLCSRDSDLFARWEAGNGPGQSDTPVSTPNPFRHEPCQYRGSDPIEYVECELCGNRQTQVAVYVCQKHGQCTASRYGNRTERSRITQACLTCPDYSFA